MGWLKNNWVWLLLGIAVVVVGYEAMCALSSEGSKAGATNWFNKLRFWKQGTRSTTGPQAAGSGGSRTESAADIPASAATAGGMLQ